MPGLGYLGVISFNSKIAPEGEKLTVSVRSMATPFVLEGSDVVESVEEAMHCAVEKMILHAGAILQLQESSPKDKNR